MRRYYFTLIIFLSLTSQISSQNYFPLEVGNRWDYFVHIDGGALGETFDSIAIEIIGKQTLTNGLEYFVLSGQIPWWHTKYVREENNEIYVFDLDDSIDCLAFRFDIPIDSSYFNCKFEMHIISINLSTTFGLQDTIQKQATSNTGYNFSINFGISGYGYSDIFVYGFYDLSGCIISGITYGNLLVSVKDEKSLPTEYFLSQNYPNPFNPITTIKYQIPDLSFTSLKVYNVLGNEITTLFNEEKSAGRYEVEFDATGLPSGIYFYRIRAGSFVETKKMVLMK